MQISCDCGSFKARLTAFPTNSPGRLVCYCNDCQDYLQRLDRTDLLDQYGGTQVVPVYPSEIEIIQGAEHLQCNRLREKGLNRWSTTCCNSPILNIRAGMPWAGVFHQTYTRSDPDYLEKLGNIRSRINGKYAKDGATYRISHKISFGDMLAVMPFIVKGKVLKKSIVSPFFKSDGNTPVKEPVVLDARSLGI